MNRNFRYGLAGIVLTGILIGAVLLARTQSPRSGVAPIESPRAKGPANAPVQIVEYSDFQCPACSRAQVELATLLPSFEGKVRLVYHHFPLENHRWAGLAHQAAECAAEQKQFWPYHDQLYLDQTVWSQSKEVPVETFIRYAKEQALNLEAFAECLSDARIAKRIRQERLAGESLGVRSTPSFFVNGELVVGTEKLREKIEKKLS